MDPRLAVTMNKESILIDNTVFVTLLFTSSPLVKVSRTDRRCQIAWEIISNTGFLPTIPAASSAVDAIIRTSVFG